MATITILDFDLTPASRSRAATYVRLARREERRWNASNEDIWQRWDDAAFYTTTAGRPRLASRCIAKRDRHDDPA